MLTAVSALCLQTTVAFANGVIIVAPAPHTRPDHDLHVLPRRPIHHWMPFVIANQRVDVAINELSAETNVEQVFANTSGRQIEGTYLFPIAEDAAVHDFTMWMNEREVGAELLDADKARQIYESIVSKMKDPALLQFAGCGLIQAKVFPIPAGGQCKIRLKYSQMLRSDMGLTDYRFLLNSPEGRNRPIETFSLRATIRTDKPLVSVFSPSHECSIDRHGEREAVVGLEKSGLTTDNDFQLFFGTGSKPFGLSLLTHRVYGQDGFFMARISPRTGSHSDVSTPKNICFVLDTSGSMAEDNKIAQAKKALKFCITNLGKNDRFSLITFSTEVRAFRSEWCQTDETALDAARAFVDDLKAVGGTDINAAVLQALSMNPEKDMPTISEGKIASTSNAWQTNPYFIVFITDGDPTVGVTEPALILKNIADANQAKSARVFVLGVGYQVNTKLLDRMADDNGGVRGYVTPSEDLELKISAFYTKLANPILANLKLAFDAVTVSDVYPKTLPDLFRGSELVVVGRYSATEGGAHTVKLIGTTRGDTKTYKYECRFPTENSGNDFLPRVWAVRKIGYLLDQLRLHGETKEVKDEVIRLAKQYGILTPYTSFLVQEDEKVAMRQGRAPTGGRSMQPAMRGTWLRNRVDMDEAAKGQAGLRGASAVAASKANMGLRAAEAEEATDLMREIAHIQRGKADEQTVNFVGSRTFYREEGRWVDAEYDGKSETVTMKLGSPAYYDFVKNNKSVGRYLAQGDRVVLCWRGRVYETMPPDSSGEIVP